MNVYDIFTSFSRPPVFLCQQLQQNMSYFLRKNSALSWPSVRPSSSELDDSDSLLSPHSSSLSLPWSWSSWREEIKTRNKWTRMNDNLRQRRLLLKLLTPKTVPLNHPGSCLSFKSLWKIYSTDLLSSSSLLPPTPPPRPRPVISSLHNGSGCPKWWWQSGLPFKLYKLFIKWGERVNRLLIDTNYTPARALHGYPCATPGYIYLVAHVGQQATSTPGRDPFLVTQIFCAYRFDFGVIHQRRPIKIWFFDPPPLSNFVSFAETSETQNILSFRTFTRNTIRRGEVVSSNLPPPLDRTSWYMAPYLWQFQDSLMGKLLLNPRNYL